MARDSHQFGSISHMMTFKVVNVSWLATRVLLVIGWWLRSWHQHKMAALVSRMFLALFTFTVGGSGDVAGIFIELNS